MHWLQRAAHNLVSLLHTHTIKQAPRCKVVLPNALPKIIEHIAANTALTWEEFVMHTWCVEPVPGGPASIPLPFVILGGLPSTTKPARDRNGTEAVDSCLSAPTLPLGCEQSSLPWPPSTTAVREPRCSQQAFVQV